MGDAEAKGALGIEEILRLIPHRHPFLLVDRVLEVVPHKRIVGVKNVTAGEPFFVGHFPDRPIMPGVLVLESILQVATILGFVSDADRKKEDGVYLLSMDNVRFSRVVTPGDVLVITIDVKRIRKLVWSFEARAEVDGEQAVFGEFTASFVK